MKKNIRKHIHNASRKNHRHYGMVELEDQGIDDKKIRQLIKEIRGIPCIEKLYLSSNPISDSGVEALASLLSVRKLDLSNTKITDSSLKYLSTMQQLESLDLSFNTGITDAGLAHLTKLSNLKDLHLQGNRISDAGAEHLFACPALRFVNVDDTLVSTTMKGMIQRNINNELNNCLPSTSHNLPKAQCEIKALHYCAVDKTRCH